MSVSDELQQQIRELFGKLDQNKDGGISKEELKVLFLNGTDDVTEMVNWMMSESDKDKNGSISYSEFFNTLKRMLKDETRTIKTIRELGLFLSVKHNKGIENDGSPATVRIGGGTSHVEKEGKEVVSHGGSPVPLRGSSSSILNKSSISTGQEVAQRQEHQEEVTTQTMTNNVENSTAPIQKEEEEEVTTTQSIICVADEPEPLEHTGQISDELKDISTPSDQSQQNKDPILPLNIHNKTKHPLLFFHTFSICFSLGFFVSTSFCFHLPSLRNM